MKKLLLTLVLGLSFTAYGHVGGHHKENIFTPKYGGTLAKVENPSSDALIAELAKDGEKGLFLFFYDRYMKQVSPDAKVKVTGKITSGRGKRAQNIDVEFKNAKNKYTLTLPKIKKRPYSIMIEVNQSGKKSMVSFQNID